MTQLDITPDLYKQIQTCASQSGHTVEEWLTLQAALETSLGALHTWFTHLVAHDLRTPLAAIMSSTEILKYYRERLTIERQDEHLHTIQMQVRVLNNLLDNVMVIQKYAIGTLVYGPAPQDLEALCRTVIEETSGMIYDQRDFRVQVGGQLPPVAYDERLLRLALTNLLLNAVQYSDEHVPVDLTLTIADDQALIQVQDRGIGIPPDEQGRVFDLFYRARNVQSTNGQGLGLTVVQNIVSLHKGTMSLESTPGQGTKVTICLPVG